jgi:iron complex transport system ATP-binding protein
MTLSAEGLAFGFRERTVGRVSSLSVGPGEAVCVLGPNGSGKTTLFRTLLGLLPPLAGRVTIDGADLASLPRARVARELTYVPQSSLEALDFTLEEVVEMGRTAHLGPFRAPQPRDKAIARAALERLGIAHLADRPLGRVSGGERQLALIARALATEARTIVMDEPTASLDFGNQRRVLQEISRLRAAGMAVLFCTHDPDHAAEVADRVLLLAGGSILSQGPPAETVTAAHLSRLYGLDIRELPRRRFG